MKNQRRNSLSDTNAYLLVCMTPRLRAFLLNFHAFVLFIYFWLCWVFGAVQAFSSCGEQGLSFSCCSLRAVECAGSVAVAQGESIKTTGRYHFTPTRMAIMLQTTTNTRRITSVREDGEKLEPLHIAGGNTN